MINKTEAQNKLNDLKEEVAKLEKIINQPTDIKDRVKSFVDACEVLNIKTYGDARIVLNLKDKYGFKSSKSIYEIENTTIQLLIICAALNEGWKPDWNNYNQPKYYPYFNAKDGGFSCDYCCPHYCLVILDSGFYLKSSDLAIYVGTQFTDIYKKHFNL